MLVIASDPGPTERIGGRTLVGDAGQRFQGFVTRLGLTRSYLLLNAFSYALIPSHGSAGARILRTEAMTTWRNQVFVAAKSPNLEAVVAFGRHAQTAVSLWPGAIDLTIANVPHPSRRNSTALLDAWRATVLHLRGGGLLPDPRP